MAVGSLKSVLFLTRENAQTKNDFFTGDGFPKFVTLSGFNNFGNIFFTLASEQTVKITSYLTRTLLPSIYFRVQHIAGFSQIKIHSLAHKICRSVWNIVHRFHQERLHNKEKWKLNKIVLWTWLYHIKISLHYTPENAKQQINLPSKQLIN